MSAALPRRVVGWFFGFQLGVTRHDDYFNSRATRVAGADLISGVGSRSSARPSGAGTATSAAGSRSRNAVQLRQYGE